jgi:site-specific DNA-methyltransferase (adenine-specific)
MPALATQSVSLLLTDPPYGQETQINRRREKLAKIAGDDGSLDVPGAITQACRLLRRGRHAYVFGPADLATTPLCAAVQLIWHKQVIGTGDLALPWGLAHEPITFAVYEPSRANRSKGYGRLAARLRQGSVISCQRIQGAATGRHPNEKPVPLLRQLIESSSLFGEIVMDPFAGSGSTLEAAALECRSAIGIEIEERFCQMAAERLAHARRSI